MKSTFIHIDTAVMIGQLHLKGYELLVYALVSGLSKGGSEWVKKPLQWYADTLCAEKGRVSNALNKLVDKGLLEVKSDWKKKYYNISCQNSNLSVAETATTSCQNSNLSVAETATDTLYNNNINNRGSNARARGEAPAPKNPDPSEKSDKSERSAQSHNPHQQPPTPQPPAPDDYSAVAEAWNEHYRCATGSNYEIINYPNTTDDLNTLSSVIRRKGPDFGILPDQPIRDFARDLFDHFRTIADKWQSDHWTLHTVRTQFNELYSKTINHGTTPNKGNDPNCRISSSYIERTMREAGLSV
ncbi:MAG: hypothetical protein SPM02_00885 [Bacteroidales bacterium]|nr:hypothetical protein [Bacteroidales bacterium]